MRLFFASILAVLIGLSVLAASMNRSGIDPGKTQIIWASDPNPARKEQVAQFNEMYPQYQLILDANNSNNQKIILQSAAGKGPTVFDSWGPKGLQLYVESGIAQDVTELAKEMGFEYTKTFPGIWPSFVYQGRQYGFPCNVNGGAVFINKNVFRKYGVPLPTDPDWTWPQFVEIMKKVTVPRKDGPGYECFGMSPTWHQEFIMQHGGHFFTPDRTRCVLDSPDAIAGYQYYLDLMFTYHVQPTPTEDKAMAGETGWAQGAMTRFANGRFATCPGGRWLLVTLRQYYTASPGENREPLELTALPLPHFTGFPKLTLAGARCALVCADSGDLRGAGAFLQYLASDRYNRELNRSADGLPPLASFVKRDEFLHNPSYPQEDFQQVFADMMQYAVSPEVSPFVEAAEADRIFNYENDQVLDRLAGQSQPDTEKAARAALTAIARKINQQIQENIARNPQLRKRYEAAQAASRAGEREKAPKP